jgi:hypothetical protein
MSPRLGCLHLIVAFTFAAALPLGAQTQTPAEQPRATELGALVGGASSSGTGAVVAGIAGWELTRWASLEARGAWFAPGDGSTAFSADVGTIVNVVPAREITPYVGAGFGFYRAMFDSPSSPMPPFYRVRVAADQRPERLMFTDPALRISAGIEFVSDTLSIRPEASSMIVWRNGRSEAIGLVGVRFGYRFEENRMK